MRPLRQQSVSDHLARGPVRGGISIERDRLRWLALMFDGLAEKGFGRAHIALCPEHEVHCLADLIYRPVEIDPLAESSDRSRQHAMSGQWVCQTGSSA